MLTLLMIKKSIIITSLIVFIGIYLSLQKSKFNSLDTIFKLSGLILTGIFPFIFFSTLYQDSSGKIFICGVLLYVAGYAIFGTSLILTSESKEP